jgi:DeoR/GlpR family transcriptional regulator of sugar metabolism
MNAETIAILNLLDAMGCRTAFLRDIEPLVSGNKFYTAEELAERYAVSEQTIRNWAKEKKLIPTIKVGIGCLRYSSSDLAEFEKKHPGSGEK